LQLPRTNRPLREPPAHHVYKHDTGHGLPAGAQVAGVAVGQG
jgi:hypothetical protein